MIIQGPSTYFLESNVDTDVIMPARFLKRIQITGFEPYAFFEKRYLNETKCIASLAEKDYVFSHKVENPDFPPNFATAQAAKFLLTWENFGCGSSREHAVFGLRNYKVIIGSAPEGKNAFADIFRDNCRQNLIWTPVISEANHAQLAAHLKKECKNNSVELRLDSDAEEISCAGMRFPYSLPKSHLNFLQSAMPAIDTAKAEIQEAMINIEKWTAQHSDRPSLYPSSSKP